MGFLKKNWTNILFIVLITLLIIPQTRMPIQVFLQKIISFSPSEISKEKRVVLTDYNWKLKSISSEAINFSQSKNNVVLVNFWATWCPPCVAEMPSLQKLYNDYGDKVDFYFVTTEEKEVVEKFLQKKEYNFPVYIQRYTEPEQLSAKALPTTYLLSKEGEIAIKKTGAASWNSDDVRTLIDSLLEEN